jgi:hypothetical protein
MSNAPRDAPREPEISSAKASRSGRVQDAVGPAQRFSKTQIVLAVVIAAASDGLCAFVVFAPPLVWTADVVTALLLFAVLGRQWLLLPGLILEAIPGLGVIPFWLLVVAAILIWGTARPKFK